MSEQVAEATAISDAVDPNNIPADGEATITSDEQGSTALPATDEQSDNQEVVSPPSDALPKDNGSDPPSDSSGEVTPSADFTVDNFEDSGLADSRIEQINSFAKDNGLTETAAQALLESESSAVKEMRDAAMADHETVVKQWREDTKTDKEIGGPKYDESVALARQGVEKFGTPELLDYLNQTHLGDHPEMVRLFTKLGKALSNDTFIKGGSGNAPAKKSNAEVFYGSSETAST